MADPVTLAALSAVALSEGIKFLYDQAAELIRRRRERKDAAAQVEIEAPAGVLAEQATPLVADLDKVADLEARLIEARRALTVYLAGDEFAKPVDPADKELTQAANHLRTLLGQVFGRELVFAGETSGGPHIVGAAKLTGDVAGEVAGARVKGLSGGTVHGQAEVQGTVLPGGSLSGADVTISGSEG
ncbi:hypothetical protein ACFWYW_28355 [Nonomuraea sp. NPDC059023]|uniref:hypothetical protein n=1 Tax=unclassified Nonomuraea TaxID=2593643 RepID=UPI0036AC8BB0